MNQTTVNSVYYLIYDNHKRRFFIMCLGIPMQIKSIDGFNAQCEAKGIQREVSLFMLQHETLKPDDFVVVHVGYAIQKVTPQEARSAWEIYDEMLAKMEPPPDA
jgi:hydrogenase expression/formation protein HypC